MMDVLAFQYCPKLVVFDKDLSSVLLCRRKGEADYDGVFSLIGGKMEHKDTAIVEALAREKSEEVGPDFRVNVLPHHSVDVLFVKKDGSHMILPHYYAVHVSGAIVLNEEYSEHAWVPFESLADFEPKISNITWISDLLRRLEPIISADDLIEI
jgi:ADP-ribose pyrophosphatase YjhB (NUDIX family)